MKPLHSTRSRMLWLVLAPCLVVFLAAVVGVLGLPHNRAHVAGPMQNRRPLGARRGHWHSASAAEHPARAPAEDAAAHRLGRAAPGATEVARRFVTVFLDYELGQHGRGVAEAINATAAPPFARLLMRTPPRLPPGEGWPMRGRLVGLEPGRPAPIGVAVVASIKRGGVITAMVLLLERKDARWVVVRIAG